MKPFILKVKHSFKPMVSHNINLREKWIFNGADGAMLNLSLSSRGNYWDVRYIGLLFICSQNHYLPFFVWIPRKYMSWACQLASGNFWPRGGTGRIVGRGDGRSRDFCFPLLSILGSMFGGKPFSSRQSALPLIQGPWAVPHYAQIFQNGPAFWILKTNFLPLSFQFSGC